MHQRIVLAMALLSVVVSACKQHAPTDLSKENIIPKPVSVNATTKVFELTKETAISVKQGSGLDFVGNYLAEVLRPATGFNLAVTESADTPGKGFFLDLVNDEELGDEGYAIEIGEDLLRVSANKPAGIFYGIQTIRQLLPAGIEKDSVQRGPWEIATGAIRDYPAYPFRGSMLDVARHFFSVDDVKRYIDLMTLYKMNVLHLSLSNDQGWRIEIKSWPKP